MNSRGQRCGVTGVVAALTLLVVIFASATVYEFSFPPTNTATTTTTMTMQSTGSCPSMSASMGMTSSTTMDSVTPMAQNASTSDYRFVLVLGPPETMLLMCQVTNSIMSGEVMVAGQMIAMNLSMTANTYHLEVHVFDVRTGDVVVVPIGSVSILVTNSTGTGMNVPVAEMFGAGEGLSDAHYGNNVQLMPGAYTILVTVANQRASFSVTIPSI